MDKGLYEKYFKRLMDVVLSFIAMIILAPVFLIIAILIKIKLGSPVIFKHTRPGKNEVLFKLYKFRSMTNQKDKDGKLLPDERRLTRFGKILRMSSLDELPELWNIFKGDMSIVGPRPLIIRYLPYYTEDEKERHSIRPGLTGLSQVNGRNNLGWDERLSLDVQYVKNVSILKDIRIILETIIKVVKRSDIASGNEMKIRSLDIERKDSYNKSIH